MIEYNQQVIDNNGPTITLVETKTLVIPNDENKEAAYAAFFTPIPPEPEPQPEPEPEPEPDAG